MRNNHNPFADSFAELSGINLLMDDLASGLRDGTIMLGGGNPGFVPQVLRRLRELLHQSTDESVKSLLGEYSAPLGDNHFRHALARLLRQIYGWNLSESNIALTNGSQAAFFSLFNLLADNGRHIVLPLAPEYIGYARLGLAPDLLLSTPSKRLQTGAQEFIYTPDIDRLDLRRAAAMCVSRPCNPSGKVLTDAELTRLRELARDAQIPLIIDNAYGEPFPGILFSETSLPWDDNIILVLSLSKLGLPAARTGIVIANADLIARLGRINAITALAPSATAARLITPLVESGEIITLSQQAIRPFYEQRAQAAVAACKQLLEGLPCRLHSIEGGIFLWLWMPNLPVTSYQLYQRCKERGVIVVPGNYFFPGITGEPDHQCIRISYVGDPQQVKRGLELIAQEIRTAYNEKRP